MVIILQQTLEDGQRFVSTVIEGAGGGGGGGGNASSEHDSSNFSMNSQHSISERSAVYKQRIDSLFGRPSLTGRSSRLLRSPLFSGGGGGGGGGVVRINGENVTRFSSHEEEEDDDDDDDEEEDAYSRITDKTSSSSRSSIITDSLNHRAIKNACSSSTSINVSSVRITCGDESRSSDLGQSVSVVSSSSSSNNNNNSTASPVTVSYVNTTPQIQPRSSSSIKIGSSTTETNANNMWRNGTYGETCCSEGEKSLGYVTRGTTPPRNSGGGGMLQFSVEYLGSVPVDGATTSLQDLQGPLKNLYGDFLSRKNVLTGQLAITAEGIRFEAPKLRLVNPFSTIAVWAAIKFVARGEECAFMPLISDPEGQDKSRLFAPMDPDFARIYVTCQSKGGGGFKNPPLFACVMREASFSLDCHAFACKCAEDAIVVAANLYQSLVDKMRSGHNNHNLEHTHHHATSKEGESGYGSLTRTSPLQSSPNSGGGNQNRSSSSSAASSPLGNSGGVGGGGDGVNLVGVESGPSSSSGIDDHKNHIHLNSRSVFSDSESIIPIRPPRRKKKYSEIPTGNLKRYNSEDSVLLKIPHRRKSFKQRPPYVNNKVKKRVQISTPDETSSGDSIHNESAIDQVLDRIINPGGMSFNDLKPSYQDLILKIALTLTQDQLYQKSKQAMKKQQHYLRKSSKVSSKRWASSGGDVSDDNSQFLNHLLKSFSKIGSKSGSKQEQNIRFSKNNPVAPAPRKVILKKPKDIHGDDAAFMSFCSGCICESCSEKCYCSLPIKSGGLLSNSKLLLNGITFPVSNNKNQKCINVGDPTCGTPTTATASSTPCPMGKACTEKKDKKQRKLCGYDSESCAESEKCYCEINQIKSNGLKIYNINLDTETSDTDTNSYDLEPFNQGKGRRDEEDGNSSNNGGSKAGGTRSVEILSYHPAKRLAYNLSPGQQTTNAMVHFEDGGHSFQGSTNSQVGGMVSPFCSPKKMEQDSKRKKSQRDKVLLITGSSHSSRLVYKDKSNGNVTTTTPTSTTPYHHNQHSSGPSSSDGKKSRNGMHHRNNNLLDIMEVEINEDDDDDTDHRHRSTDTDTGEDTGSGGGGIAPEKVLSMKKTAEIAAMFTDLKLDQTTNVIPDLGSSNNFESMQNPDDSTASLDFEASLGYLP
ncbi:uncharacterized protein LOC110845841 [Folsomia candida]|uniref:uncharacterized protein LOC110845841 n=1 Tax=Folsomia candida TaxID=158441 RepID=UPI000B8F0C78|nr:uncharacterized protein LOC110845841 [Folsomia candida]